MEKKVARIGGAVLVVLAFACVVAGLFSPPMEWLAWSIPANILIFGGVAALAYGCWDELSFNLKE